MDHGGNGKTRKRHKMLTFGLDWLDGYACGVHETHDDIRTIGWARAKGLMKKAIQAFIANPPQTDFGRGLCDAYLDSVGC
jgi:hypothetical protein